jgi:hypothetical protein
MHQKAFEFVAGCLQRLPPRKSVLEFGGRNVNGSVRVLFDGGVSYTSIDLVAGSGVDAVGDAVTYVPTSTPDTVICTEVLEHSPMWPLIVQHAGTVLGEEGVLILTRATYPRAPHSSADGHVLYPHEHEYYHNIDPMELGAVVEGAGFKEWDLEVEELVGDLRLLARM